MPEDTLDQAVAGAVDSAEATSTPEPVQEATTTPTETAPAETPAETQPEEEAPAQPSPDEVREAMGIYNLLKNPETAPQVAQMLANQYGLLPKQETPKPAAPKISDIVKEALGPDYAFLSERLGPAFEQVLGAAIAPVQRQLMEAQVKNEFETARRDLNERTKGDFGKLEGEITKLMDKIRPAQGVPVGEYLTSLYTLAKHGRAPQAISRETAQKVVSRMQQNAQERLPAPSAASEPRLVQGPKRPSIDDAIAAALRGERFEG